MGRVVSNSTLPVAGMVAVNWKTWAAREIVGYHIMQFEDMDVVLHAICLNGDFIEGSVLEDAPETKSWVFLPRMWIDNDVSVKFLIERMMVIAQEKAVASDPKALRERMYQKLAKLTQDAARHNPLP